MLLSMDNTRLNQQKSMILKLSIIVIIIIITLMMKKMAREKTSK